MVYKFCFAMHIPTITNTSNLIKQHTLIYPKVQLNILDGNMIHKPFIVQRYWYEIEAVIYLRYF